VVVVIVVVVVVVLVVVPISVLVVVVVVVTVAVVVAVAVAVMVSVRVEVGGGLVPEEQATNRAEAKRHGRICRLPSMVVFLSCKLCSDRQPRSRWGEM
jgi:hypothetical protein